MDKFKFAFYTLAAILGIVVPLTTDINRGSSVTATFNWLLILLALYLGMIYLRDEFKDVAIYNMSVGLLVVGISLYIFAILGTSSPNNLTALIYLLPVPPTIAIGLVKIHLKKWYAEDIEKNISQKPTKLSWVIWLLIALFLGFFIAVVMAVIIGGALLSIL